MSLLLWSLGAALVALGIAQGGWYWVAVWVGLNFIALGLAHAVGFPRIFGKRPDGTLPWWSWILFLPLLLSSLAVWQLLRFGLNEAAYHKIDDQLEIGRRLSAAEADYNYAAWLDLTAEFQEPGPIRRSSSYINFPILDGGAPTAAALKSMLDRLPQGRIFVHCAQGHGRAGLVTLALLLKSGRAATIEEGLAKLKAVRPGVLLSPAQKRCAREFFDLLKH